MKYEILQFCIFLFGGRRFGDDIERKGERDRDREREAETEIHMFSYGLRKGRERGRVGTYFIRETRIIKTIL